MSRIFICSPFAAKTKEQQDLNVLIAQAMCRKALFEGHAPYAPHLIYPQMLDDNKVEQRNLGLRAGQEFMKVCDKVWQFSEVMSEGMKSDLRSHGGKTELISLKDLEPHIAVIKQGS